MKKALALLFCLCSLLPLTAQNRQQPTDSLVRLMSAQSAELIQEKNRNYRKVIGPARFLHNKTYLICDTAYWDVDVHIIQAFGHVRILQNETVLTSEKLDYYIDDDLAQFRGAVVQLQDKDRNTLRTRYLDYNTKDSVAIFKRGGAMRDKDGQLIESNNGSYDAKERVFRFDGNVNMFTDSVFVKTEDLTYFSKDSRAVFEYGVDIWRGADMLSARRGDYERENELFHFFDEVHGMTNKQEVWSDTLHFNKLTQDFELHGNVQVTDDSRKVSGLGEHVWYVDTLDRITMSGDATIIAEIEDESNKQKPQDTLYMAADRIVRTAVKRCDVTEGRVKDSEKRKADLEVDPVSAYRRKAYEEAQKRAAEQERELAEAQGKKLPDKTMAPTATPPDNPAPVADTGGSAGSDSEPTTDHPDMAPADSTITELPDTTKLSFIQAVGKVRVFKSDMQARCDSLLYSDLDSLALLYLDPIVWNEGNRQYVSDSITVVVENSRMKKASLMSNAFITIQEDSVSFDQIRGTEMMAYFDTSTVLQRFDALGGASAVFYLEENDALATVNKVESKMLSAYFDKGELQRIYYFDNPHNDAYPTVQLPKDDRQMKGFRWDPERRPTGMVDITPYTPRESERLAYEGRPQAKFPQTEIYFPGYMKEVYAGLAARDSAQRASRRMRDSLELDKPKMKPVPDSLGKIPSRSDTTATIPSDGPVTEEELKKLEETSETEETLESPEPVEKPQPDEARQPALPDSLRRSMPDSLGTSRRLKDSLQTTKPLSPEDSLRAAERARELVEKAAKEAEKAAQKAVRDSIRQAKLAKKEARWAALDARDAVKDSIKTAKKQVQYRESVLKKLEIRDKEQAREQARLEKYIRHYEKIKARRDERMAKHPERALRKLKAEQKKAEKAEKAALKKADQEQKAAEKKAAKEQEAAEKKAGQAEKNAAKKADKPKKKK